MLEALNPVNADRERKGIEPFRVGVGIHSGPAIIGDVQVTAQCSV